jgi:hypothetical protein
VKSPDMRDSWRPIQRVHVNHEMTGVLPRRLDRLLPAREGWRQATRPKLVGAKFINAAKRSRLNRGRKGKGA